MPLHRSTWLRAWMSLALWAAASAVSAEGARLYSVGMQTASFVDETRRNWSETGARPLEALVWYPADANAREQEWDAARIFKAGRSARGAAPLSAASRWPLIVLSHGTGGSAAGLAWLGEALAAQGYLVAAANHHGNTAAEPAPALQGTLIWWDRPRDVSVLIDRMLADPVWGPRIDAERVGVAGFSIGGYTALAAVGARLSRTQWRAFCADAANEASCRLPPEVAGRFPPNEDVRLLTQDARVIAAVERMDDDYRDPRIKAAFAIAPVVGGAVRRDSLGRIALPVEIVVGADDDQAVPRVNAVPLSQGIPNATLKVFPKVTHYSFLPVCNERGNTYAREVCTDPVGVSRQALHQQVGAMAIQFFSQALRLAR